MEDKSLLASWYKKEDVMVAKILSKNQVTKIGVKNRDLTRYMS